MAHSTIAIPKATDRIAQKKATGSKTSKKDQNSFASVMAKEQTSSQKVKNETDQKSGQKNNTVSKQSKPQVTRLPEMPGISLQNPVLAGRTPNDLLRMQTYNKASQDIRQTQAVDGFLKSASNATSLDIARNMNAAANLRTIAAGGNGAGFALTSSDFIHTRNRVSSTSKSSSRKKRAVEDMGIGKLSARFESGGDGIAAIGYDRNGGTSYGKYQIASRVGTMKSFLSFLDTEAPDLAKRLRNAGPANTGSRSGAMPNEWRTIAKEQPERFEKLQESFILQSHYKPALEAIEQRIGLDSSSLSAAMREVIWSTAVQHGPAGAARIFSQADNMSGKSTSANYERKLINNVYNVRADQFGSSTNQVRAAVRNRFKQEKQLALNLLESTSRGTIA